MWRWLSGDLRNPRLIVFKGFLFLLTGLLAAALILLEHFSLKTALLLGLAIWGFCRFYYFAFYVLEHYVDDSYRFSGLLSLGRYLLRGGWRRKPPGD